MCVKHRAIKYVSNNTIPKYYAKLQFQVERDGL